MSSPIIYFNKNSIANGSMAGSLTATVEVAEVLEGSVQAVWTGTSPVGNLVLSASNNNIDFTQLSSDAVSGNAGSIFKALTSIGYVYLKIDYARTSGTGTLNVYVCGKHH